MSEHDTVKPDTIKKEHIGSSFESFLEEEGILDECTATAKARVAEMERADSRKVIETLLKALVNTVASDCGSYWNKENQAAYDEAHEALAQPEQEEAFGYLADHRGKGLHFHYKPCEDGFPIYTKPQPLRRLSDEDVERIAMLKECWNTVDFDGSVLSWKTFAAKLIDAIEKLNQ